MANEEIVKIAADLRADKPVSPVTVRTLLNWYSAQRRGYWVVAAIKRDLESAGISTNPDFEAAWIDTPIMFVLNTPPDVGSGHLPEPIDAATNDGSAEPSADAAAWVSRDPAYRVSKLQAANQKIISSTPDTSLSELVTTMLARDLSQLPVMTNERDVKGMVSWRTIGSQIAIGTPGTCARNYMEPHHEISADTSIFAAIPIIVQHGYVLVRAANQMISGIITSSDLSDQFRQLSEPFLLLGEIENFVRNLIGERFDLTELRLLKEHLSISHNIDSVADLTFGDYVRLLENQERWDKLEIKVNRKVFCADLDAVREIRNDVMHFDPDGISSDALETLRNFTNLMKQIEKIHKNK